MRQNTIFSFLTRPEYKTNTTAVRSITGCNITKAVFVWGSIWAARLELIPLYHKYTDCWQ